MVRIKTLLIGAAMLTVVGGLLATTLPGGSGLKGWLAKGGGKAELIPAAPSGAVDVGFAQFMLLHHDQVVVLGNAVQKKASPKVASVGRKFAADQLQEIGILKGWLSLWEKSWVPSTGDMSSWMTLRDNDIDKVALGNYIDLCRNTQGGMPGAASVEEIQALEDSTDPKKTDVLFLQYMIRHHQGGVPMAVYAAQHAETLVVRQAAWRMLIDQMREVRQLAMMLRELGAMPLPDPVPVPDLGALIATLKASPGFAVPRLDQQQQLYKASQGG